MLTKSSKEKMGSQSGVMSDDDDGSYSANWNLPHEIQYSYFKDDMNNVVSDGEQDSASGLLIVCAEQEGSSKYDADSKSLTIPDSLPTNLFLLDRDDPYRRRFMGFIGLLLLLLLVALTFSTVYLAWDRNELKQSQQTLKTQVDNLIHETSRVKQVATTDPLALTAGEKKADSKFVLADNCWLKAEIELGECLQNTKECWSDFTSQAKKTMDKFVLFDNDGDGDASTILQQAGAWNEMFSEATLSVAKASIKITDSMLEFGKKMDESVLTTVKQTRDAIEEASIFTRL